MPLIRAFVALLAAVSLLLASGSPGSADTGEVSDPAGDDIVGPEGPGLDITGAAFDNRSRRLVVTASFDALHTGALIISVAPRKGPGVRLVSKFREGHRARSFVLAGSFDDEGAELGGRIGCARYRVTWDREDGTVRLSVPPRCINGGQYDDLRFSVLTETRGGDTDYAPDEGPGIGTGTHTRWIPRG